VLIFLLALAHKGAILHEPERLTYYRISGISASSIRAVRDPINRFVRAVKNAARHAPGPACTRYFSLPHRH